jgi:hypothetical protein
MKRLILVHGDKGGVGKSVFARALLDRYIRNGIPVDVYDSDKRNPDLSRFYASKTTVSLVDVTSKTAFDAVLDKLEANDTRALVDLAAGAGDVLNRLISGDIRLGAALDDMKARATIVYVLSRSRPSVAGLNVALADFKEVPCDWVIVRNTYFGETEKFSRYENSNTRKEVLSRGAVEIDMPELLDDLYDDLDQNSVAFMDAAEGDKLTFSNRRRVRAWIERFDEEVSKAVAVL